VSTTTWEPDLVSPELLTLTRSLGDPARDLVILAEGNTSQRLGDGRIVVKATGAAMSAATAEDFVVVAARPLLELVRDPASTQADLSAALDAGVHDGRSRRASIETVVHAATDAEFVGHTHPTDVVALLASVHAATAWADHVYSDEAVVVGRSAFLPYASPGLDLGRAHLALADAERAEHGEVARLVLLGNHGIVVAGPTPAAVEAVTAMTVKGARVRAGAYAAGGLAPLPRAAMAAFFARADITARQRDLGTAAGGDVRP